MVHRAIFGSFERFIAILTEQFQGAFPIWLSPVQTIVLPLTDKNVKYAKEIEKKLKLKNIRAQTDERSETLPAKIRDAAMQKIPYLLIVGPREEETAKLAVRNRNGKDLGQMDIIEVIQQINKDIENKS